MHPAAHGIGTQASDAAPPEESFGDSPELRRRRVRLGVISILAGIFFAIAFAVFVQVGVTTDTVSDLSDVPRWKWIAMSTALGIGVVLSIVVFGVRGIALREYEDRLDRQRAEHLRAERDQALPEAQEELTRLLDANRALLDEYQKPVRARARTSYIFAQTAIAVGLIVLVAGALTLLLVNESSTQLVIAALTAVGTALSGYIARTFLRVYERAQDQLNFYFREPLVTSYLLTAERLTEKLEGERREQAYAEMVAEIVRAFRGDLSPTSAAPDGPASPPSS